MWEAHLDQVLHKKRRELKSTADGSYTVKETVDVEPLMHGVKMMSDAQVETPVRDRAGRLFLGSVDPIVGRQWAKESGTEFLSKEWKEVCKKKLMSNEFSRFKAASVRKYV